MINNMMHYLSMELELPSMSYGTVLKLSVVTSVVSKYAFTENTEMKCFSYGSKITKNLLKMFFLHLCGSIPKKWPFLKFASITCVEKLTVML